MQQKLLHTLRLVEKLEMEVNEWTRKVGDLKAELVAKCIRSLKAQQAAEVKLECET